MQVSICLLPHTFTSDITKCYEAVRGEIQKHIKKVVHMCLCMCIYPVNQGDHRLLDGHSHFVAI